MNNPGHWQHWAQDTAVKNEQSRDTGNIGHKTRQSRMDNPETLAKLGTRHRMKSNKTTTTKNNTEN